MMRSRQQAIQSYWIGGDVGNVLKATGLHLYGLHNRLPLRFDVGDRKKNYGMIPARSYTQKETQLIQAITNLFKGLVTFIEQ
jgi:hypothetical protein